MTTGERTIRTSLMLSNLIPLIATNLNERIWTRLSILSLCQRTPFLPTIRLSICLSFACIPCLFTCIICLYSMHPLLVSFVYIIRLYHSPSEPGTLKKAFERSNLDPNAYPWLPWFRWESHYKFFAQNFCLKSFFRFSKQNFRFKTKSRWFSSFSSNWIKNSTSIPAESVGVREAWMRFSEFWFKFRFKIFANSFGKLVALKNTSRTSKTFKMKVFPLDWRSPTSLSTNFAAYELHRHRLRKFVAFKLSTLKIVKWFAFNSNDSNRTV